MRFVPVKELEEKKDDLKAEVEWLQREITVRPARPPALRVPTDPRPSPPFQEECGKNAAVKHEGKE